MLKQAIILRKDLGMGAGKLCSQSAHASVIAFEKALEKSPAAARKWSSEGAKKIVLKVYSEAELGAVYGKAARAKLPCSLVIDAGFTQIPAGTATAVAIGPAEESKIDAITGELKLL